MKFLSHAHIFKCCTPLEYLVRITEKLFRSSVFHRNIIVNLEQLNSLSIKENVSVVEKCGSDVDSSKKLKKFLLKFCEFSFSILCNNIEDEIENNVINHKFRLF